MAEKKSRKASKSPKRQNRILVFDLVRILCIAIIVYDHSRLLIIPEINQYFFADAMGPFNIYTNGLQGYAVYGLILISGAVLEYNYQGIEKLHGYLQFLFRRFIRLYPAFWMSLILGLILFVVLSPLISSAVWLNSIPSLLFEFTGFFVVLGQGPGNINNMGWFIATIVSLYILYPWFSKIIRKYGLGALAGFCLMSWGLRYLILTYNIVPINLFWRWFPLCNAFEFCLGIYIVQANLYPKKVNTSPVIRELSDLCYYIFLFHTIVITAFVKYLAYPPSPLAVFDYSILPNNPYAANTIDYFQMMIAVFVVSWIAMKIDARIRAWIMQRDAIRNFLNVENS
ncbi:acyltransferase family protein [Methanoregula sp.]|uniref:acyltransferase family protein n=1 Tax=Methanoregula sp. TaxID=2052170 RepID=UPI003BAEC7FB